ncbi:MULTISPECIES: hypothetical protein [unclassified Streptomyces]|uniref:hypothetical protein n=1 Tax=unclassified Streptomyces TaxID=2593676 RepID=UPI0035E033D6
MFKSKGPGAVVIAVALAALCVGCSGTAESDAQGGGGGGGGQVATTAPEATAEDSASAEATVKVETPEEAPVPEASATSGASVDPASPPPEKVRDAFAGLQATLNDSCATDCAYFLGRVYEELDGLDRAMKADPKGPGHFPEPIDWIAKLRGVLGGDRSFENLKKNEKLLVGTRDKINTWMQGHPDDYR